MWYEGGDNSNGESKYAGTTAFDTDTKAGFRISEFFHFCSKLVKKEPKERRYYCKTCRDFMCSHSGTERYEINCSGVEED